MPVENGGCQMPDARCRMPDTGCQMPRGQEDPRPLVWEVGVGSSPGFQLRTTLTPTRAGALLSGTRDFDTPVKFPVPSSQDAPSPS
jgi:hypothetical protein